ncbi:FkbM family methyltransferase [Seohaeicola sp. SP36]|uniref:FkbM family methyltransferase n=1 Tax=unclassified Seohaeicola TaxID=2641111 RepID=UPI00237A9C03|nr:MULTISPECIES: FkbM family methyltransferase [unclassified Seohaeicola]MDD9709814.1 FkbM family methyltransferase [Seohaeicola sp. 4SK31]MDD9738065.1 FkbM family methyltransferase [Seohaeicola sp. SP36]
MPFISHAQNYEDVMLWRALKHVEKGFYIDVGAWSPDSDSVTRSFYEAGWRGINVEPLPTMHLQLCRRRPHDVNLAMAVSDTQGTQEFHNIDETGLSTLHQVEAKRAADTIGAASVFDVQVTTLADIWREHVPPGQPVHFLKIDVEGLEQKVVRGADWANNRPWIIVIEATIPQTPRENYQEWDPLLTEANYRFVWFDGLNRFYLAEEHAVLAEFFRSPPNVFDDFRRISEVQLEQRAIAAEAALHEEAVRNSKLEEFMTEMRNHISAEIGLLQAFLQNQRVSPKVSKEEFEEFQRPLWFSIFLKPSGEPSKLIRRVLFHKSGKPRGIFKKWVLRTNGSPRKIFKVWMLSEDYQKLPGAIPLKKLYQHNQGSLMALSPNAIRVSQRIAKIRSSVSHLE